MKKMMITAVMTAAATVASFAQAEPMTMHALSVNNTNSAAPSAVTGDVKYNAYLGKYRTYQSRVNAPQVVDTEIAAFEAVAETSGRKFGIRSDRNI
ncbi:hypothetical protein [Pseudomaricurvus sp. HS19]|uniref:hypothetical protein n=1 Tax=Pseudomaricurvus sp. HS19 TaxID=2692626 RepID=UPI00136CE50C|nr:hypothetical protein [Pseudomaricurvus sp. HS19]MYM62373.1 hypothetical protein [Pseudomaricurvus sp. HS19]